MPSRVWRARRFTRVDATLHVGALFARGPVRGDVFWPGPIHARTQAFQLQSIRTFVFAQRGPRAVGPRRWSSMADRANRRIRPSASAQVRSRGASAVVGQYEHPNSSQAFTEKRSAGCAAHGAIFLVASRRRGRKQKPPRSDPGASPFSRTPGVSRAARAAGELARALGRERRSELMSAGGTGSRLLLPVREKPRGV